MTSRNSSKRNEHSGARINQRRERLPNSFRERSHTSHERWLRTWHRRTDALTAWFYRASGRGVSLPEFHENSVIWSLFLLLFALLFQLTCFLLVVTTNRQLVRELEPSLSFRVAQEASNLGSLDFLTLPPSSSSELAIRTPGTISGDARRMLRGRLLKEREKERWESLPMDVLFPVGFQGGAWDITVPEDMEHTLVLNTFVVAQVSH